MTLLTHNHHGTCENVLTDGTFVTFGNVDAGTTGHCGRRDANNFGFVDVLSQNSPRDTVVRIRPNCHKILS